MVARPNGGSTHREAGDRPSRPEVGGRPSQVADRREAGRRSNQSLAPAAEAARSHVTPEDLRAGLRQLDAGITHRSAMPSGFARALCATASLDLLREQLDAT